MLNAEVVLDTAKRTALSKCTNMNKQPAMQQGGRAELWGIAQNSRLYLVTQSLSFTKKFKNLFDFEQREGDCETVLVIL